MLSNPEKVLLVFFIISTFFAFTLPVIYRIRIICKGRPENRFNHIIKRIWVAFTKVFFQRCTLKNERKWTGLIHAFIFYGALTFDTATINHTLEGFIPDFHLFGHTKFASFFSLMINIFAILVLTGVIFFVTKRFILRPKAYATTPVDSGIIYILLISATLSYLYFESFSIALHPETERLAFLGGYFAQLIRNTGLSPSIIATHFKISWWTHLIVVYTFISYVPHSKYFHMFAAPFNVLFRSDDAMCSLKHLDIENSEVFGTERTTDYTWKDLLDAFACVECGRCQDVCPAFSTEKPLSPKMIIFNLREYLKKEGKKIISNEKDISTLIPDVISEDEIWNCTTCGSCMHVCPVEVEHIPKIVGLRQSQVLMQGKFPSELNSFFRNIETNSNPWGIGFANRANWTEGLNVKLMSDYSDAEYLFWVGCAGSFDDNGKKISQSVVKILNYAAIDFAILGTEEKCCGDSAKRLGNEYLFQMLAGENIETFKKYNVKKIIVACPHGYNTFKNEYPKLIDLLPNLSPEEKENLKKIEIIHHVLLINDLIKSGRLALKSKCDKTITYHDSCYLGRHNSIIQEPRYILEASSKNKLIELDNNKEHSFCCGAGGGLMWTEESTGTRINHMRTEEIIEKNSDIVVTSCPFCKTMLSDGLKDKGKESIQVLDIAQIVSENLEESNQ
ncbi:MAG: 4Fe-4S dicluster domain-containing protein [Candidatus Aminicenantes bacterium]|nr:4Fe-4S dicluster domain-containing protein [Candidatus Aminicenantes bacterium]